MPGVKFFNQGHSQTDWGRYIFPKVGLVEALERQLKHLTAGQGTTDSLGRRLDTYVIPHGCYTPAEAKHRLTRNCISGFWRQGTSYEY